MMLTDYLLSTTLPTEMLEAPFWYTEDTFTKVAGPDGEEGNYIIVTDLYRSTPARREALVGKIKRVTGIERWGSPWVLVDGDRVRGVPLNPIVPAGTTVMAFDGDALVHWGRSVRTILREMPAPNIHLTRFAVEAETMMPFWVAMPPVPQALLPAPDDDDETRVLKQEARSKKSRYDHAIASLMNEGYQRGWHSHLDDLFDAISQPQPRRRIVTTAVVRALLPEYRDGSPVTDAVEHGRLSEETARSLSVASRGAIVNTHIHVPTVSSGPIGDDPDMGELGRDTEDGINRVLREFDKLGNALEYIDHNVIHHFEGVDY